MLKEARMVSLVLAIVVLAAVVLFSVQNASPAGVSFFVWRFESSLAVIIFLSVVVGIVIGMLFFRRFFVEEETAETESGCAGIAGFRSATFCPGDKAVRYYLASQCVLKRLEAPCLYDIREDELYELDEQAFAYLIRAAEPSGAGPPEDRAFLESCLEEGLLVSSPATGVRPVPRESPVPSLRYLELQITNRCNLHCRHCYVGDPGTTELSVGDLKTILDEFQEMQGLRLLITGGEPILHRQFGAFNELLPDYAFRKVLFTNGQALDGDVLRRLQVDEIQVSIDGMQYGHDLIRGPGTFRKAIDAAERIHRRGFRFQLPPWCIAAILMSLTR